MKLPQEGVLLLIILVFLWQIFCKGFALWRAAKGSQKKWFIVFIAIFYVNDLGIVELIYLFFYAKHRLTLQEIQSWTKRLHK